MFSGGNYTPILLSLTAAAAAAADGITVKELASGRFEVAFTSTTIVDVGEAQALLVPTAWSLCQGAYPELGQYRFSSEETIGEESASKSTEQFHFIQEISCVEAPPAVASVDEVSHPPESMSAPDLEQHIRTLSEGYFRSLYGGEYARAYGLLSADMREYRSYEEWVQQAEALRAEAGRVTAINVHTVTIYDNPPNAPRSGLYVAADYQNALDLMPYHCGYLVWFRARSGQFEITREESGVLPQKVLEQIPEEDHESVLAQMRCAAR